MDEKLYTVREAATKAGITYGAMRNLLYKGVVRFVKEGAHTFVLESSLNEYINGANNLRDAILKKIGPKLEDPLDKIATDYAEGNQRVIQFVADYPALKAELDRRLQQRIEFAHKHVDDVISGLAADYNEHGEAALDTPFLKDAPEAVINAIRRRAAELQSRVENQGKN